LGEGDGAGGGVCAQREFVATRRMGTNGIRFMGRLNHEPSTRFALERPSETEW